MKSKIGEYKVLSSCTLWLTGLSGAGKTTIANNVKRKIDEITGREDQTFILDGDIIRKGLNRDLGYHPEDIHENNRRVAEVAKLF